MPTEASRLQAIRERVESGERLSFEDGLALEESNDLFALGWAYPLGRIYFLGILAVAILLAYEHALVRPDDLTRVNVAFFQVNIAISLGLLAFGVADLLVAGP